MAFPEFTLRQIGRMIGSPYEAEGSALGFGRRSGRADSPQPATGGEAGIAEWARAAGRCLEKDAFAARLDGAQVEDELSSIFRETPEFGRSLAERLAEVHDSSSSGSLALIGGGGEAVVFFEPEGQRVLKLLGGAGRAGFGWHAAVDGDGRWFLRPGTLAESLRRHALMERYFPSGLEIEAIGAEAEFLVLSQPFFVGGHPDEETLSARMYAQGWEPIDLPSELELLRTITWRKGRTLATDVRAENAILTESDREVRPFDFILSEMPA